MKEPTPTPNPEPKKDDPEPGPAPKGKEPVAGAPEKYEPFKAPEGITLSETALTEAGTLFKELNLTQEQGQKLVDFQAAQMKAIAEDATNVYNQTRDGWRKEVLADATLAQNGELRPEVKQKMASAISAMGESGEAFREALNITGVGDNPAFIRGFLQMAEKFTEGTHVPGKGPVAPNKSGQTRPTAAQSMYPNLPSAG